MADQTSPIQPIEAAINVATRLNENFDAASPAMLYGRDARTTTGLTWGYIGGRFGGALITSGTVTLDASATSYLVAAQADGAVSVSDTTTDWDDADNFLRLYKITTGVSAVTDYEDHRQAIGGSGGGGGGGDILAADITDSTTVGRAVLTAANAGAGRAAIGAMANPMTTAGDMIIGGASGAPTRLAAGTNNIDVLGMASGAPAWVKRAPLIIPIACSDESTALAAGVAKVTFRMPCAMTLTAVRASLTTAQASGSIFTVDINEGGTTILSTKLTIDNTEKTSTTAATPAVISDTALADDAEITIAIDQVGDGTAKGLKVYLIGWPA